MRKSFLLIIILFGINTYSQIPVNGLVAYYPFNGNANDESGNGYNGSPNGTILTADRFGVEGKAYSFSYPSWIDCGDILDNVLTTNTYSISIWYKRNSDDPPGTTINKWYNITYHIDNSFYMGTFGYCSDALCTATSNANIGEWTHDVAVLSNGSLSYYRNGNLIASSNGNISLTTDIPLTIGAVYTHAAEQYQFKGGIDDIRIFDRALTETEIQALYNENGWPLTQGPVAYYPFNENANDYSGNGNNPTVVNEITYVAGHISSAAQFTSTSYTEIPDNNTFDFSNAEGVTFAMWIRQEQSTEGIIFIKMGAPGGMNDDEYAVSIYSTGKLYGAINGPNYQQKYIISNSSLNLNTWNHVVFMWNKADSKISFYINGVLDTTANSPVTSIQNTNIPLRIGRSIQDYMYSFIGSMDEFRIYDRALTEAEILELYNEGGQTLPEFTVDFFTPNSDAGLITYIGDEILSHQNQLTLGINLTQSSIPPNTLYNVKVAAYINQDTINVKLNTPGNILDEDNDGLIDEIQNETTVKFLIYSNLLLENLVNSDIKLVIEEIDGEPTNIDFDKNISYYFAKTQQGNRSFELGTDAYQFENLAGLSWAEFRAFLFQYGLPVNVGQTLFAWVSASGGRCWGMSATAGKYFIDPLSKPHPSSVFSWLPTDVSVTNSITIADLNTIIFDIKHIVKPSNDETFQALQNYFSEQKPSLLNLWKEGKITGRHAVLATSMVLIDEFAQIKNYDSEYPHHPPSYDGEWYYTYNLTDHSFTTNRNLYNYDRFEAFTDQVFSINKNFISIEILVQNLINFYLNNYLKEFSVGCPVNIMIENTQGFKYGFNMSGIFINEIPGCRHIKVPSDYNSTDSITVIYAPEGDNYEVEINSYNQGSLIFATNQAQGNNSLKSNYADSVVITPTTKAYFIENNPQSNLQVDYDGDGQVDTTIILINNDEYCVDDSIHSDWNMLSIPYLTSQNLKTELFPTAISDAFWFSGSYVACDILESRRGYWLKFDSPLNNLTCGQSIDDTIHINAGWNMIGCFNEDVPIGNIDTDPPAILTSSFFGYSGGYYAADTLKLGKGYWIKSNQSGILNLNQSTYKTNKNQMRIEDTWASITIGDSKSREMELYFAEGVNSEFYQLPPQPPSGAFDIRFDTGTLVEDLSKGDKLISIYGANYPITIRITGTNLTVQDVINGNTFNQTLNDGEEITIYDKRIDKILLKGENKIEIPISYSLAQNYPNPFNPNTNIKFSIAKEVKVNLAVYNILGEKVKELKNEIMKPGFYDVEFNASSLASGIYLYRITAGEYVETKKMILLK